MLQSIEDKIPFSHVDKIKKLKQILQKTSKSTSYELEELLLLSSKIMDSITENLRHKIICRRKWNDGCSVYIRTVCSLYSRQTRVL